MPLSVIMSELCTVYQRFRPILCKTWKAKSYMSLCAHNILLCKRFVNDILVIISPVTKAEIKKLVLIKCNSFLDKKT